MLQYLEPFNCVQTNEKCWIELLVLHSNICNDFTVCQQMINIETELLLLDCNDWNHLTVCQNKK